VENYEIIHSSSPFLDRGSDPVPPDYEPHALTQVNLLSGCHPWKPWQRFATVYISSAFVIFWETGCN
jgi:hypothetical protein